MDKRPQHAHCKLPNTPRVSGKILEYYQKFGQERDLEKFMRLYSPASSQESEKTEDDYAASTKISCDKPQKSSEKISSTYSSESLAIMPSRPLSVYGETNSKSLPNIDIQGQIIDENGNNPSNDVIIDINIEADGEKEKILSISTEDLKTPKKTFKSAKTQTPESVAKTHRRLEWDSLGDVGYKKSMSTSNISIMERSLLKEFFKEKSVVSEPSPAARNGEDHHKTNEHKIAQNFKADEIEHSTPPLACSTLFPTENRSKPKMLSQSTSSTSLNEKFEKYAQTSIIKFPTFRSQEIQCTLSSSNSIVEGTATPSSFEYYSSRSSKSRSSKSSDNMLNTNTRHEVKPQEHPFIASITDLLAKRKALGEQNQQKYQLNNIKDLQIKFQAALNENKENQSHSAINLSSASSFSLSKQAPELDLGIQLICSLIDAKSLNGKQKKQLIRDIIKRLTRIEGDDKTNNSTTANSSEGTTGSSNNCHQNQEYDSVSNKTHKKNETISLELGVSPLLAEPMNTKEKSTTSSTNISEGYDGVLVPNAAATKIDKETQSESIMIERKSSENVQAVTNHKSRPEILETKCLKTNRCTQTSRTSLTPSTSATSTSDLTTQKILMKANKDFEADQPTMREWLNPLTQSEIEYDKKKQLEIKKKAAAQQEKIMKKSTHDCGRVQQLNWIETEIKRLECLKHLLLKDETLTKSSTSASSFATSLHKNSTKDSKQTDKLYDTVYTDKSSVLSESAEQLVQEIEIILEESHEDVVNFKDNIKHTKNRKKEIKIMYEKENDTLKKTQEKPKLQIIDENINIHEEQLFKHKPAEDDSKQHKQREKIDTPTTDTSKESESIKDMVRQRKREFMEAYKSKKQHSYDALKQKQKDFKYLNLPQKSVTTTDSEHYSVPHTLPRKYIPKDIIYYTQHPLPKVPTEKDDTKKRISQQQSNKPQHMETIRVTAANTDSYATTSTSSMLCVTSDISVPMGSQNSSSSLVSAHQFNKAPTTVKTGVAIQTSDSIRFSKPIYGPTKTHSTVIPHNPTIFSTTACIQVKPKGIAYVIEFDDNNKNKKTSAAGDSDVNANHLKSFAALKTNSSKSSSANEQALTLQEHLEKRKPKFLKHSKERKAILNKLQSMRQERVRQLREIIENTSINSLDRRLQYLPPPPIQKVRILRTKDMKALTNKRVASLPEVVAKQEREKEERKRRTNRVLRDLFNKRLQKRVRSGKLSLNHSKTVV